MRPVTVALLVAGVAAAGVGAYFFLRKKQVAVTAETPAPSTTVTTKAPAQTVYGVDVGALTTGDHVTRKNALAPAIATRFGVPANIASGFTNIAGKLSLSSYAEKYVTTKVPIVGKVAEAPVTAVKAVGSFIGGLF